MVQWWSSLFNICSAKEIHAMFLLRFDPLRRRFQKWGKREIFSGLSQKLWLMVWLVFVIELWSSQSKYLHERLSWLSAQHVCIKSNDFTGKLEKLIIKARLKALKKNHGENHVFVCRVELFSVLVMTMFDYLTPKLRWNSLSPPEKTCKCQNWIANICVHKYICLWAEKQEQNQKDICLQSSRCFRE